MLELRAHADPDVMKLGLESPYHCSKYHTACANVSIFQSLTLSVRVLTRSDFYQSATDVAHGDVNPPYHLTVMRER